MSYTKTNTLSAGSKVNADNLNENWSDGRRWLQTISNSDISADCFDMEEIVRPDRIVDLRGEYTSAITERYTSGLFIGIVVGDNKNGRHYFTSQTKQSDIASKEQYQDIPNAATTFFLEQKAHVVVRVYGYVDALPTLQLADNGSSNIFWLYVNESRQGETSCYSASDGGTSTSGSPAYNGIEKNRNIPVNFVWSGNLSKGSHSILLRVNPRLEASWIDNIYFSCDCTYIAT